MNSVATNPPPNAKICFIKRQNEWRILSGDWPYSKLLENKHNIINQCADVPFLGFLYGLKCDFLIYRESLPLDEYDIIITLDPFLKKRPANCKSLFYMNPEPDFDLSSPPSEPYDAILNNYTDVSHPGNVPYWYRYLLDEMAIFSRPKQVGKVFVSKRSGTVTLNDRKTITEAWGRRTYADYYQELSTCEYAINMDEFASAGQVIAECSVFDVICFGKKRKLFQRLLFPEYCVADTVEQALEKIKELDNNPTLKRSLLEEISVRKSAIDYGQLSLPAVMRPQQRNETHSPHLSPAALRNSNTMISPICTLSEKPKNRIGFALSTKERTELTRQVLPGLDCGGFDLIWCDGSKTAEGRALASPEHFKQTPLAEIHHDVTGGPDAAIQFSLKRLLALGYDYVGLIENDIQLKPGWLEAILSAWKAAEQDGLRVGSVTARSMISRVLAQGPRYVVKWNLGAGMVLFSRAAAEAVLADYRLGTAKEIQENFLTSTGVDVSPAWELFMEQPDRPLGADWRFASALWKNGMISIGTIPALAENIDVDIRDFCRTDYVRSAEQELPGYCVTIEQLKTGLACCAPFSKIPSPVFQGAATWIESGGEKFVSNCPACSVPSPVVVSKKNHHYHRCPSCGCIFTPKIDLSVLETENHGHSLRHDQNQDTLRLHRLTEALGEWPEKVVDFGCGKGETTRFLQSQGLNVIGIDQDTPVQLKDLADGSVDGIVMVEVIEHLYAPQEVFHEFNRVLKQGGVAYIESSFADGKNLLAWEYLDPAIGHCTVHTLNSVTVLAEKSGFSVRWINPNVCCFTKIPLTAEEVDALAIVGEGIADPILTVAITVHRSESQLRACLENLSRQTIFSHCELLVIDRNSLENERTVVADFQKNFPNIRYIHTPRISAAGAWNRSLQLARSRYWINLHATDALRDDALEILAAAMDKFPECAFAYADAAWTSEANDHFPSNHVTKTVKYPHYAPLEVLFHNITGSLQFFRTESLRSLKGFDASLHFAAGYDVVQKALLAKMNAVHVPEVLCLCHQPAAKSEALAQRAAQEQRFVQDRCRENLGISHIFQVDPDKPSAAADALAMLGVCAVKFSVPGGEKPLEDPEFATACFHAALELDPENPTAGTNLIALSHKLKRLDPCEAELVARWPKMRQWINLFRLGEGAHQPPMKHALAGPVYRPSDFANRPTAEQLAREPEALRPWICRIEGRHVYLSEDIFPRPAGLHYQPEELQTGAKRLAELLAALPPFYAHIGGAGDMLLLLASFYDQKPDAVVFSHPNGVGAAKALFDAFPKLSKIYFLPQHTDPYFHIALRQFVFELRHCRGAGTTPRDNYEDEWKASLDIEKKYRIQKAPRWAAAWRQNENSRRVALAPKGSLAGMIGSKRNIILPEQWPLVIAHILERGFEPVILGVPAEAKEYPALPGCVDARGESFPGQMKLIGQCAGVVAADSWAKTFSALAEIPTIVFEPIKGADLGAWKDPSDWVFIEPWPSIKMIRSLDEFRRAFDARIAKIPGAEPAPNPRPNVAWEGSFLDYGSLSHINRELTTRLRLVGRMNLTRVGPSAANSRAQTDAPMRQLAEQLAAKAPANTAVTVRHQWPPNWSRPTSGSLVIIQPWEYGALPKAWVEAAKNVDEFWVPSPLVRAMYVDSGIAPEKVRVVPNGVDTQRFRPGVAPLKLKTKKKFKFLFVGGTIFRKGPDILLEAFSQVFTAADDVSLVIKDFGGDSFYHGQTAEAAIRAIQQKPNAPEILYLNDELTPEQMPSLYAACDCLVLPYRGEGFGMPVLEAMACGKPVIVTAGGATDSFVSAEAGWKIPSGGVRLPDRVGDIPLVKNGWLLEPSRPHFGALLKYAARHPDECRKRGAAGRAIAEKKFDWNDIAAAVAHCLKELAARAPVPTTAIAAPAKRSAPAKPVSVPSVANIGRLDEARELLLRKQLSAAWMAAAAAVAKRPFHPEAFLLLAEIALADGDGRIARICTHRARELAPGWTVLKQLAKKAKTENRKAETNATQFTLPEPTGNRLSVCLIVKNEEKFLAQCLKSVRAIASQIVVVDTGSADRTVEIAREFGAEIHSFAWCDDFAAARNAALEHATGDWILMLDADEELPAAQHAKLLADLKDAATIAFRLPLVNAGQENEGRSFVPRLFRNAPGIYFTGRIHEQVFPSLLAVAKNWGLNTALGTAEILHHGYAKDLIRDRNKIERNLKLLRAAVEENPDDANLLMNLGLELVRSDNLADGVEKYREAFDRMSAQPADEVVPELREVLLTQFTSHLYKLRAHDEVVQVLNSPLAKQTSLTASLHFALGLAHFELKQFREAADQMRQCLSKRKQPGLTPINTDILTAAPQHCLALSLAKLGEFAAAEKAFLAALAENGHTEAAKLDYAKFLQGQNRPVDALHRLHEIIVAQPRFIAAWKLGGEIALSKAEFLEFARDWTGEAIRALPENPVIATQRAEALMLNGDTAAAGELWEKIWRSEPQPRSLAALILCEFAGGEPAHAPHASDETAASLAFVEWYQKLIAVGARATILQINGHLERLPRALPTAARWLTAALAEAQRPVPETAPNP